MTKINEIERARFTEIIDQYSEEASKAHEHSDSCDAACLGCIKASLVNHIKNYLVMMETI